MEIRMDGGGGSEYPSKMKMSGVAPIKEARWLSIQCLFRWWWLFIQCLLYVEKKREKKM